MEKGKYILGTSGKGKPLFAESIKEKHLKNIKSNLDDSFNNLSFQIDLINEQVIRETTLVGFLNNNSSRLQHIIDEEPRLMRWWFDNIEIALDAMAKIKHHLDHRLICIEKNALFIQIGEFKSKIQ